MLGLIRKLFLKAIGGSRNERLVRERMNFVLEQINPLEEQMRAMSDAEMLEKSRELRRRLTGGQGRNDIKPEAFALVREASRRARNHRQFDVQLVAGLVLDEGWIAEEATGEGKTIACYPAIYMAVLEGMHIHVVTVNDYLVRRDAEFARPIFELLGLTVGYITAEMSNEQRKPMYACDVTYGTNSEFGFDYLRDNMKVSVSDQVQGSLDFAIVDEVDSILIDEARTPLIISGPAYGQSDRYAKVDKVARKVIERNRPWDRANKRVESLKRTIKSLNGELVKARGEELESVQRKLADAQGELAEAEKKLAAEVKHYEVQMDKKTVYMTHEGIGVAQDEAGLGSFYVGANMDWPHMMEQSLRAHMVYERDKDYVVQNGRVIIVDEFTGRLLEGREWSDGLHQAVEAKERVPIKDENQTLATITLQNYFKLYKKLAGMTGTAMTEANEFMKIYKLDVVAVPTNRPVNRLDYEDRIYADVGAKFDAIVEEINKVSKQGRPVLVGTTSIEKSEELSEALTRRYGIEHQVLNARPENAAREAEIVALAGQQRLLRRGAKQMVGTVTIATNMAGRGTDIKLGPGVVCPNCKVPPPEKLVELGVEQEDLFPPGSTKCCLYCPQYDPVTDCAHCYKPKTDKDFPDRGRTDCCKEVPCGVHIVGTERHEARRIDNQLRGRSGRQGDPGSGRFFLSIRDDLIAIFAGEWTLRVLGWLGLQGDVAIEDRRVTRGIERAQKKVEERNFETRKHLLEYDEVMDYQRKAFYSQRQKILEGRELEGLVMDMVLASVEDGVESYLSGRYPRRCIAEWARQNLQVSVGEERIHAEGPEDLANLEDELRELAKEEARSVISMTLGEYMDQDTEQEEWDLRGLSAWAMSRFSVVLSQNQLRKMSPKEVEETLAAASAEKIDQVDLAPVAKYLEQGYTERALSEWAASKFGIQAAPDELTSDPARAGEVLTGKVRAAYLRREIEYPVEYILERVEGQGGAGNVNALNTLVTWANGKFQMGLTVDELQNARMEDIRARLLGESRRWLAEGGLEEVVRSGLGSAPQVKPAIEFARARFDTDIKASDLDGDVIAKVIEAGRNFLRREMTELERFVLLQIYDTSWKDHLLGMDHLKSSIGLRSFAEQDPRVAYKREGSRLFQEMLAGVREKVTDIIFKVRPGAGMEMASVYQISSMVHEQLTGYDHLARDMADQAAAAQPQRVATIVRDVPRVGRNDPCPCGSGKKFKRCCGKGK